MPKNPFIQYLQSYAAEHRDLGVRRSEDWAGQLVNDLDPESILDVGCGDGALLYRYLKKTPREFYGVEGSPTCRAKAEARGIKVLDFDLNGRWPVESGKFDVVFCTQVIEHLHNTRLFVEEIYRVLKLGGTAIVTSENLCSLLNCFAMCMGYTPFPLMQVCGRYLGNPLGLHYQEPTQEPLPIDHPAFAGVSGHVRVLTVRQAQEIFTLSGFDTEARSIGILPLPDGLSRILESKVIHRGHFLLVRARKPAK